MLNGKLNELDTDLGILGINFKEEFSISSVLDATVLTERTIELEIFNFSGNTGISDLDGTITLAVFVATLELIEAVLILDERSTCFFEHLAHIQFP